MKSTVLSSATSRYAVNTGLYGTSDPRRLSVCATPERLEMNIAVIFSLGLDSVGEELGLELTSVLLDDLESCLVTLVVFVDPLLALATVVVVLELSLLLACCLATAAFWLRIHFLMSLSLSLAPLPAYSSGWTNTASFGRLGRSSQTKSTKFWRGWTSLLPRSYRPLKRRVARSWAIMRESMPIFDPRGHRMTHSSQSLVPCQPTFCSDQLESSSRWAWIQ